MKLTKWLFEENLEEKIKQEKKRRLEKLYNDLVQISTGQTSFQEYPIIPENIKISPENFEIIFDIEFDENFVFISDILENTFGIPNNLKDQLCKNISVKLINLTDQSYVVKIPTKLKEIKLHYAVKDDIKKILDPIFIFYRNSNTILQKEILPDNSELAETILRVYNIEKIDFSIEDFTNSFRILATYQYKNKKYISILSTDGNFIDSFIEVYIDEILQSPKLRTLLVPTFIDALSDGFDLKIENYTSNFDDGQVRILLSRTELDPQLFNITDEEQLNLKQKQIFSKYKQDTVKDRSAITFKFTFYTNEILANTETDPFIVLKTTYPYPEDSKLKEYMIKLAREGFQPLTEEHVVDSLLEETDFLQNIRLFWQI